MRRVFKKSYRRVVQGLALALIIGAVFMGCSRSSSGGGGLGGLAPGWPDQPGGDLLWTVDDLADAILSGMPNLTIVDCRFNEAPLPDVKPFDDGHIMGAIWIDWRDLSDEIPVEFPPAGDIDQKLGTERGMVKTDTIVLYGDGALNHQAPFRMFWMLVSYGCTDVHIVDGGLNQWIAKGYDQNPLLWDDTDWQDYTIQPENFGAVLDTSDLAVGEGVLEAVENHLTTIKVIIDARTPWEFAGEAAERYQIRAGRIPTSVNLWWLDAIDQDTGLIKSPQEVTNLFQSVGAGPNNEIIAVATTGVRSTVLYFLCQLLGYDCKVYQGGLYNWSAIDPPPNPPFDWKPYIVEREGPYNHKSILKGNKRPEYGAASAQLGNRVYLFGGIYYDEANKISQTTNEIWRFNPVVTPDYEGAGTACWKRMGPTMPAALFGMTAAADPVNNAILTFGGRNPAGNVFKYITMSLVDSNHEVTTTGVLSVALPEPLTGAASCTVGNDIYLFGGSTDDTPAGATAKAYKIIPGFPPTIDDAAVEDLPSARSQCGVAVLDGKIYCIGGLTANETLLNEVLEYDPANPGLGWVPVSSMNTARSGVQGAVASGRIYVCGGMAGNGSKGFHATGSVESFKPGESWRNETAMRVAKFDHCVEGIGGSHIYMIGGYNFPSDSRINGVDFLNVVGFQPGSFDTKQPMPGPQDSGPSVALNGKIYIFGGTEAGSVTARVLEYDPVADSYATMDPIPYGPVRGASAAAFGNIAIVCGGAAGIDPPKPVKSTYSFDPSKPSGDQWTQLADMPHVRYGAAIAYFRDENGVYNTANLGKDLFFLIGGKDWYGVNQDTTFIYGYGTSYDEWLNGIIGPLPWARVWSGAAVVNDMLILTGGAGPQGYPLADTLAIDLTIPPIPMPQWDFIATMPTARYGHATAVIGNRFYNIAGFTPEGNERGVTGAVEIFDAAKGRWEVRKPLETGRGLCAAGAAPDGSGNAIFVMGGFATGPMLYFGDTVRMSP